MGETAASKIDLQFERRPSFSKETWRVINQEQVDATNFLPKLIHLLRSIEESNMDRHKAAQALVTLMHLSFGPGEWRTDDPDGDVETIELLAHLHESIGALYKNTKGIDQTVEVNKAVDAAEKLGQIFARVGISEHFPDNQYLPSFLVGMEIATQILKEIALNGTQDLRDLSVSNYLERLNGGVTDKIFAVLDREAIKPEDFTPTLRGYANWKQSQQIADNGGENITLLDDHRPK